MQPLQYAEMQIGTKRRDRFPLLTLFLFFLSVCRISPVRATGVLTRSPVNILIITCHNFNYADLPIYNPQTAIGVSNVDLRAAQPEHPTDFHTAFSRCSVSHAWLLTGRVAQRHGLTNQ